MPLSTDPLAVDPLTVDPDALGRLLADVSDGYGDVPAPDGWTAQPPYQRFASI
jgi:hypothetical protein